MRCEVKEEPPRERNFQIVGNAYLKFSISLTYYLFHNPTSFILVWKYFSNELAHS